MASTSQDQLLKFFWLSSIQWEHSREKLIALKGDSIATLVLITAGTQMDTIN
jgi:hypothetical protein